MKNFAPIILLLLLSCSFQGLAQETKLYDQDLYSKPRSLTYRVSTQVIRTVITQRDKSGSKKEGEATGRQWFPKKDQYKRCGIEVEEIKGRKVYRLTPKNVFSDKVILYYHGGGYQEGPFVLQWNFLARLAEITGSVAYLVDYRLAPEHPFPAGLDDCYAAFRTLSDRHGADKIILFGDSAGGGMCLAVGQSARQDQKPNAMGMILLSPWLRPGFYDERQEEIAPHDPLLKPNPLQKGAFEYSPDGDFENPLIAPYYADLTGLPPILLLIGTYDILFPECEDFIRKHEGKGYPLKTVVAAKMCHVWPIGVGIYPEGERAVQQMGEWINDQ